MRLYSECFDSFPGDVAEWTKAADCKSAGVSLRRFESCHPQTFFSTEGRFVENSSAGVAQLARASAFQAEGRGFESRLPLHLDRAHVAQAAEHILGKDEVSGSSPLVGSMPPVSVARRRRVRAHVEGG